MKNIRRTRAARQTDWHAQYKMLASTFFCLVTAVFAFQPPVYGQSLLAGFTAGQHGVGASGEASYSIPISTPPGRAGIEPKLAISYSSHAGNGLLGLGFSLSGISQITRCPKSLAQDGSFGAPDLSAGDRFCLDGQRLVAVAGAYGQASSEYRTERDSFARITYSGNIMIATGLIRTINPAVFTVQTKDGKTLTYGGTGGATLRRSSTDVIWALKSVQDVYGNQMNISYQNSGGELYPTQIDYTLNSTNGAAAFNSVKFVWEGRTDPQNAYIGGFAVETKVRLKAIQAFTGATKVKEYTLAYQYGTASGSSRITRIQECAFSATNTGGSCLAPVSFNWTPDITPGLQDPTEKLGWPSTGEKYYLGDFNGDGKVDLYVIRFRGGWVLYHGTGSGFVEKSAGTWPAELEQIYLGDFDGDGKTDVFAVAFNASATRSWVLYRSTGDSIQEVKAGGWPANLERFVVADFDGDGKADLLVLPHNQAGWRLYQWNGADLVETKRGDWPGNGETFYTGDFDGDGRTDLFVTPLNNPPGYVIMMWDGNGFVKKAEGAWPSSGEKYYFGDFNGDGKTDVFVIPLDSSGWRMYHSTGVDIQEVSRGSWPSTLEKIFPGDFNGDGKTDLFVAAHEAGWKLYYSTGNTIVKRAEGGWPSSGEMYQVDDFAGLGKSEVFLNPALKPNGYEYRRAGTNTHYPEAIQTVIKADFNNAGVASADVPSVKFLYAPLTDANVYVKGVGATYPLVDLQPATYVVSSVQVNDGLGGGFIQTRQYAYGGMRSESGAGRGLLGFAWMKEFDVSTAIETYTEFRQDWPFIGQPSKTETRYLGNVSTISTSPSSNARLLSRTTTSYQKEVQGAALEYTPNQRFFVYPSQSLSERWDLDGTQFPTTTTTTEFEEPRLVVGSLQWGNPTRTVVTTSDGHSKVTVNQYLPADTNNWILGRLSKSTVTASSPARTITVPAVSDQSGGTPPPIPINPATLSAIFQLLLED